MFKITWYWALLLLIALLSFGISVAGGVSQWDRIHRIGVFKSDRPIPLDGDLVKWRGAETTTLDGKPLAGHPRNTTDYTLRDKRGLYLSFGAIARTRRVC